MSTFERDEYKWRETYFVFFNAAKRPTMKKVERLLRNVNDRFELINPREDEDGRFESITVIAPDDYAALDISFEAGEEVLEQGAVLYQELKQSVTEDDERTKIARLPKFDARFDLLHFEQTTADAGDEDDEMLDPSALLIVLDALVELTGGIGIDPASGAVF